MSTVGSYIWHDLECGAYAEDLGLWRALVDAHGEPVLDVGAGTGRIALDLARRGARVTALDRDPELLAELRRRGEGLPLDTVEADAREFALGRRFPLCIVPMQTIQLLDGPAGRAAFLTCARGSPRTRRRAGDRPGRRARAVRDGARRPHSPARHPRARRCRLCQPADGGPPGWRRLHPRAPARGDHHRRHPLGAGQHDPARSARRRTSSRPRRTPSAWPCWDGSRSRSPRSTSAARW